jgi:hypothetical protein
MVKASARIYRTEAFMLWSEQDNYDQGLSLYPSKTFLSRE